MISGSSWFLYFAIEHIQNTETMENFDKLNFGTVIRPFILFYSCFQMILCVQELTRKVLPKIIHKTYHWTLK